MPGEQGTGGGLVAAALHHLRAGGGQAEAAGEAGHGHEVPLGPRHHPGHRVPLGQGQGGGGQGRLVRRVGDLPVQKVGAFPRRFGIGDQDDVVVGGDVLKAVRAVCPASMSAAATIRTTGRNGNRVLQIGVAVRGVGLVWFAVGSGGASGAKFERAYQSG